MCTDIFEHIFSHELHSEGSHDFSKSDHGLEEKLTHLLYHLKDNRGNILGILSGDSSDLFLRYFKEYLTEIFVRYPDCMRPDVPTAFALNYMVGSFAESVKWWIKNGVKETPEFIANHYLRLAGYI